MLGKILILDDTREHNVRETMTGGMVGVAVILGAMGRTSVTVRHDPNWAF